jgi:hypothetical protein
VKPTEIMFFAVAFLLPLIGGGALLYFLAKPKKGTPEEETPKEEMPKEEMKDE